MYFKKTSTIAFQLFRYWTKKASKQYPNYEFVIVDERKLVTDLEDSIESAFKSLTKEEKAYSRTKIGYDYGFFMGFVSSNLNTHWVHEYITKQTSIYKEFNALKAVIMFLKIDTLTTIKIQELYKALLAQDHNIDNYVNTIEFKPTSEKIVNKLMSEQPAETSPIIQALENRQMDLLVEILKVKAPNFMPDLENYFSEEEVEKAIQSFENQ
jgi:hypothetical protein